MSRPPDPEAFRKALGRFASGVTLITTRDGDGRDRGMTLSAFSSLSLDPPLVLACVGHEATIAGAVAAATHFGISVLAEGQEALSRRFADPDADRFDGVPIVRGTQDIALIDGALAHLECRIIARHEAGDHTIVIGAVEAVSAREGRPLLYYRRRYGRFAR